MYPVLFEIGGFTVYGYGFMLSMTFMVGSMLLYREMLRKGMDEDMVGPCTIIAVVLGLFGAKLFDAFEYWDRFARDPIKFLWRGSGLTYLGGFILSTTGIYIYVRWIKGASFADFCDAIAPGLMLGYGIARIGCQLAGDGDYGIPTDLPWAMAYPNGTVPTTELVHPTPVYEAIASAVLFGILWKLRLKPRAAGWLFFTYLIFSGIERFPVEFIRRNPEWVMGLTQSQLISLGLILVGTIGVVVKNKETAAAARAA